jgi:DNA polymerase-4
MNYHISNNPLKYLFLDLNSYFASVEQQLNPDLRGKPVAVVPVESDTTCAIAASYEAKAFGIKTGTFIYEAKKLCPKLICVPARHDKYVEFHHKILEETDKHIPIDELYSIDEFACELQGVEQTEDGARDLAYRIKKGINDNVGEAIKCSIGVAQNKFLAKLGTELDKPDGFTIITERDLPTKICQLNLIDITGIGKNMERRLRLNNIATVNDLYQLAPKEMRKIWHSVEGERFWYLLRGYNLPKKETTKRTVGHSHVLAPEFRPVKKSKIVAQRLLLKAASRLRRLGYYCRDLDLGVRVENGPRIGLHKSFYRACDNFTLMGALNSLWGDLLKETGESVRFKKVSIVLHGLCPSAEVKNQPELFDKQKDSYSQKISKNEKISKAMDVLNAKYGRDTVVAGFAPDTSTQFSGTKIAFNRIPEIEEFHE